MRHVGVNASVLGILLLAAMPAGAQSMAELGAAMGINGGLNRTGASSATTALRARETVAGQTSGGGGWKDAGDGHLSGAGGGKGWATASSGAGAGGKSGWATPGSGPQGGSGAAKGWATVSSGSGAGGKGGWVSRKDAGAAVARRR
jgi:hypothetical protein